MSIRELPHRVHADGRDTRDQVINALRAAQALFTPKSPPIAKQMATGPSAEQAIRKPRVLAAKRAPICQDGRTAAPAPSQAEPNPVPAAHIRRIKIWLDCGMTLAQVAKVYGVSSSVIKGLL